MLGDSVGTQARSRKKNFPAIKEHSEKTGHDAAKTNVTILEKDIKNHEQRLFLEAWHSIIRTRSMNILNSQHVI